MQCFEWWAFEVLAIFAGLLGTLQLAAHVAVINVCAVVFMIPLGIQFTASGLVGTSIGAGNPSQAKRYALTAVLFSFVCMGMISILLTTQSEHVARIFTKDPETIAIIVETLPMISLYIIVSGI